MLLVPALVVLIALTLSPLVIAQPVDERKVEAKKDVERLQEKLEDAVERYNYACSKLEETRGLIEDNAAEIAQAEKDLSANKKRLNSRVRALYMTRHNKLLDVMVNADNFDEFLVGLDLAKKVGQNDAGLVKKVKESRARLESAKQSLAQRKQEQEAARQEMAATKADVNRELSGAKGELANIEQEIQNALARRAEEAATTTTRTNPRVNDPVPRRNRPPGAPHDGVVGVAYDQLGKPYRWGTAGPDSFDCSGLTMYCYRVGAGISITHSSYGQAHCGVAVSVSELAPGDILGFRGWGHVGLYVGGGEFIHAPHTGDVVRVASLSARGNYCGAVRP